MLQKKLKDLKLIVFDLDGTLLTDEGQIHQSIIDLTSELQNKGVIFSIASGRLHSAIIDYAKMLKLSAPLVSLDGCMIKSINNPTIIYESYIKQKHIQRALKFANTYLLNYALCCADFILINESNSNVPNLLDKFGAEFKEVEDFSPYMETVLETVILSTNKDYIKHVFDKMSFPYCTGLALNYYQSHSKGIFNLELRRKGSSKAKGFKRLCRHLKINSTEAAVVGDWYNDIPLFSTNALKVAVKNAVPELIRISDIQLDKTNNEAGVADFLEMVLKAKKN